jgi:hypothetical protein
MVPNNVVTKIDRKGDVSHHFQKNTHRILLTLSLTRQSHGTAEHFSHSFIYIYILYIYIFISHPFQILQPSLLTNSPKTIQNPDSRIHVCCLWLKMKRFWIAKKMGSVQVAAALLCTWNALRCVSLYWVPGTYRKWPFKWENDIKWL